MRLLGPVLRRVGPLSSPLSKRHRSGAQNRSLKELRQWFSSDEVEHPFSFRVICETLGLDTDYLRGGILGGTPPAIDRGDDR